MERIAKITFEEAKELAKGRNELILDKEGIYYGLFIDDKLVSMTSVIEKKDIKLKANFTLPEYRGKGYFTKLLQYICANTGKKITARCLDTSLGIYLKNGFNKLWERQYKSFRITNVVRVNYGGQGDTSTLQA